MTSFMLKSATRAKLGLGYHYSCFRRSISNQTSTINRFAALWGNGDYGRLGSGSLDSQWRPSFISPAAFANQNLKSIACGGAHTLFLTENGRVFATGLNDFGQLGISDPSLTYTIHPIQVHGLSNEEIVQVSAGYYHSSAITADGVLYMWGKNSSGQLGLGKKAAKVVPVPSKVESLNDVATVKMAALGCDHSIAVTNKGEALSWGGGGGSGRLGHGHTATFFGFLSSSGNEYTPRLIKNLEGVKIKSVSAGMLHSACIDESGSVFIFGEGVFKNKLSLGEAKGATIPSMITKVPYSEIVACGGYHTCVITNGGELYTWGANENGCLGIGCSDSIELPKRVEGSFMRNSVSKVSCGWKHTAAISGDGIVYTWGWGGSNGTFSVDGHSSGGQLGLGNDVDYIEPAEVSFGGMNVRAMERSHRRRRHRRSSKSNNLCCRHLIQISHCRPKPILESAS